MKRKIFKNGITGGFTLVELLIVIALIGILSVAVLATINPIEQANKARDAKFQNDAAEVLGAIERYYASGQTYPWMDIVEDVYTVDDEFMAVSTQSGFGVCSVDGVSDATADCDTDLTAGLLITTDELKTSFMNKEPFDADGDMMDWLYLVKMANTTDNYVCFVPKAKANRRSTSGLKQLTANATTGVPTTIEDADPEADFENGVATVAWEDPSSFLFKCVPE